MEVLSYKEFFREWKSWETFENRFDGRNGVYAFRLKHKFERLQGTSDVLYIGMCEQNPKRNKRPGLWHRLNNYRQNLQGGSERLKRVEALVGGKSKIEYAYVVCEQPRETEKALLENYYQVHFELPPLTEFGGRSSGDILLIKQSDNARSAFINEKGVPGTHLTID